MFDNTFCQRVGHKLACALLLPLCLGLAWWKSQAQPEPHATAQVPAGEPLTHWEGRALRPLALSEMETRFGRQFPGTLTRLTDDRQVLLLRTVLRPTRMLHPADDCYRGLGWHIARQRLERDAQARLWRCFEAARSGQRQRVCERIVDARGRGFTDASSWYWAALLQQSQGPWQATTVASPL